MPRDVSSRREAAFFEAAADAFVGIQLRYPLIRTLMISGINCEGSETFATCLVRVISSAGLEAKKLVLEDEVESIASAESAKEGEVGRLSDVSYVRSILERAAMGGYVVIPTRDFLAERESLVLASVVEGVVLLAQSGRTKEAALRDARSRVGEASTLLLGSVFVA